MKTTTTVIIAAMIALTSATSCRKSGDYTCRCTGPGPAERHIGVDGSSRKEAKRICDDHEHSHPAGDVKCNLL